MTNHYNIVSFRIERSVGIVIQKCRVENPPRNLVGMGGGVVTEHSEAFELVGGGVGVDFAGGFHGAIFVIHTLGGVFGLMSFCECR